MDKPENCITDWNEDTSVMLEISNIKIMQQTPNYIFF